MIPRCKSLRKWNVSSGLWPARPARRRTTSSRRPSRPAPRLAGIQPKPPPFPEEIEKRINEIIARVSALPILDHRTDDEILGYNEIGVPE